ncbi:MAG: hypothetical protein HYR91_01925 [Flavobacteriia bacterium]|nr:hypothetical protein [Flavobacteriia bacterium]
MKKFTFYNQLDTMDCGPTCFRMVAKYYGLTISFSQLRKLSDTTRSGSSLSAIANAAEQIGFKTLGVKIDLETLMNEAPLPCILFWNNNHFVVLYLNEVNVVNNFFAMKEF